MMRTEVREEQRVRIPREDLLLARAPGLEVDVGRRRRGHHVGAGAAADARGVADERDARRRVEIRDVMGRVTGRVLDLRSRARRSSASRRPRRRGRCFAGTGFTSPHSAIHVLRVQPSGAGEELRRIGQVRRAAAVDDDVDVRMLFENQPDRSRVIQMDVRHEDLPDVLEADALARQRRGELRIVVAGPGSTSATPERRAGSPSR